jgi:hypothetical protein
MAEQTQYTAPEFTAWGAEQSREQGRLGVELPTPGACEPINPVQFVGGGLFPTQILDGGNQIVLLNEWVAVPRRIYTDGRKHPPADELLPTWEGHSIGRWDGDTLVVDTVGLNGRTRPINGYVANAVSATPESLKVPRLPSSDQMHLVERFRLVGNGDILEVTRTITDPKTYLRPFSNTDPSGASCGPRRAGVLLLRQHAHQGRRSLAMKRVSSAVLPQRCFCRAP